MEEQINQSPILAPPPPVLLIYHPYYPPMMPAFITNTATFIPLVTTPLNTSPHVHKEEKSQKLLDKKTVKKPKKKQARSSMLKMVLLKNARKVEMMVKTRSFVCDYFTNPQRQTS